MLDPLQLDGTSVFIEEIQPKDFKYVIQWRNDKTINRFLNQPEELTLEKQQIWYKKYIRDNTQGLMVMKDRKTDVPFGTIGWTHLDLYQKTCIEGRLLVGNSEYRGSVPLIEGIILLGDYLYYDIGINVMYIHVVENNKKALRLNRKFGFVENMDQCKYPKELNVNGMKQIEFCRTVEQYEKAKEKILPPLRMLLEGYMSIN